MAERFSTQFLKQQGARRKTVEDAGRLVNTFQDRKGFEHALNAANTALMDKTLVSSSLNSEQYFFAKSFFQQRGLTETTAATMAVLSMDAAKIMEVSVMVFLEPMRKNPDANLDFEAYVAANLFRPNSSQQTYLLQKENVNSLRSRDILP